MDVVDNGEKKQTLEVVINITPEESAELRAAIREETRASDALEEATLTYRLALHHARSKRSAIFETLGDKYGFDPTNAHDYHATENKLTRKK